jgi:hypothetical protein
MKQEDGKLSLQTATNSSPPIRMPPTHLPPASADSLPW